MAGNYLKNAIGDRINLLMADGYFLARLHMEKTTNLLDSVM